VKIKFVIILIASCVLLSFSCLSTKVEHLDKNGFDNLYKVNEILYRSEQPSEEGFKVILDLGIKTVINFRQLQTDKPNSKIEDLKLIHQPINTWKISYEDVLLALKTISVSDKPVLIHCKHGSDRTGCVIAAYRMVYEGWSKEEAINEFLEDKYGYHQSWFPNILELLQMLNVEQLKLDLKLVKDTKCSYQY